MTSNFEVDGTAEKTRWYILAIFFYVYAMQINNWFTFSSIPDEVESYYNLSDPGNNKVNSTIDLLLNWGPMIFLPITPFSAYLLSYPVVGLQWTIRSAVTLIFFGSFIRCIPSLLVAMDIGTYKISNDFWNTLIFLHIGQLVNDIAGPLVMSPPTKLSVIWFPENERALATGIGVSAGVCGTMIGFLLGPNVHYVDTLLYINLILSFIPFVCVWIYFPKSPSKLPNQASLNALLSASMAQLNQDEEEVDIHKPLLNDLENIQNENHINDNQEHKPSFKKHFGSFWNELKGLGRNSSAMIIVMVSGLTSGAYYGWSGVFQDMLSPLGLDDKNIGLIGFLFNLFLFIGSISSGFVAGSCFQGKLKLFLINMYSLAAIVIFILLLILPSPLKQDGSLIILNDNSSDLTKNVILNSLIGLYGLLLGGTAASGYELLAEVSYPCSEGTSTTALVFVTNATTLIFVGIGIVNTTYETLLSLILIILSVVALLFVREEYKRGNVH